MITYKSDPSDSNDSDPGQVIGDIIDGTLTGVVEAFNPFSGSSSSDDNNNPNE